MVARIKLTVTGIKINHFFYFLLQHSLLLTRAAYWSDRAVYEPEAVVERRTIRRNCITVHLKRGSVQQLGIP